MMHEISAKNGAKSAQFCCKQCRFLAVGPARSELQVAVSTLPMDWMDLGTILRETGRSNSPATARANSRTA